MFAFVFYAIRMMAHLHSLGIVIAMHALDVRACVPAKDMLCEAGDIHFAVVSSLDSANDCRI